MELSELGNLSPPDFGPVASAFVASKSSVPVLIGPVGSGKSSAACYKIMRMALSTPPCLDGMVRSRTFIARNSYRELVDSTIKTFFTWVPKALGTWRPSDFTFTISAGNQHHEFVFRSFDTAQDLGKLLSTEYSYFYFSEARELPVELFDMIPARLRYPSQKQCPGFVGSGVIESNPSDPSHWLYTYFVEGSGIGYELFQQPSGLSEKAENTKNLPPNYYANISVGKPQQWVDCFVHGKWVFYGNDLPVFPEFVHSIHVSRETLVPSKNLPLFVGLDFGLTPAAAIFQQHPSGQYRVIDELCTTNMGAARFGRELRKLLNERYAGLQATITGDPAGDQRAQTDEYTPYSMLAKAGIEAMPASTNDWTIRRETLARLLVARDMAGEPAILLSPDAKVLVRGLSGDYRYQRIQASGSARFSETPIKSPSSHVCEAFVYGLMGANEDRHLTGDPEWEGKIKEDLGRFYQGDTQQPMRGYKRSAK